MTKQLFFKLLIAENKQRKVFRKTRERKAGKVSTGKYDITVLKEFENLLVNENIETVVKHLKSGDLVIPLYLTPEWDELKGGNYKCLK